MLFAAILVGVCVREREACGWKERKLRSHIYSMQKKEKGNYKGLKLFYLLNHNNLMHYL